MWQMAAAATLDLLLGDPRWLPHPVRGMGWLCVVLERLTRRLFGRRTDLAGVATVLAVLTAVGAVVLGTCALAARLHPLLADAVAVLLIYTSVAARDLAQHSGRVFRALARGDLPEARRRVGWMVGRDTGALSASEVTRATVESVAESIVDGVTAPLLYAALFGPLGAVAYRAINTMDSLFGYKNERYLRFGRCAARLDDAANFIPARLTGPMIVLAARLLSLRWRNAWRVLRRDAHRHPSPNSGQAEAAVAGALGVRLGGVNHYAGIPARKPSIGSPDEPLAAVHILRAERLMQVTSVIFLLFCLGVAALVHG